MVAVKQNGMHMQNRIRGAAPMSRVQGVTGKMNRTDEQKKKLNQKTLLRLQGGMKAVS